MAQTRPSPTLSRGFTRLGRFLAPYGAQLIVEVINGVPSSMGSERKPPERTPSTTFDNISRGGRQSLMTGAKTQFRSTR